MAEKERKNWREFCHAALRAKGPDELLKIVQEPNPALKREEQVRRDFREAIRANQASPKSTVQNCEIWGEAVISQRSRNPPALASRGSVQALRRKTPREHSLAVARTAFSMPDLIRDNMRWRVGPSALILLLSALHLLVFAPSAHAVSPATAEKNAQQWSLRVDKVDTGDVSPDPSLESALHKNLMRELARTKRFKQVLLSGDRNANEVPELLILKTTVQEYAPGGETRGTALDDAGLLGDIGGLFLRLCGRTTVSGATQLNARIQLYTREGHLVLDRVVEGDVGFTGDNSRATHNLAHNVAVTLKRSTLPDTAIVGSEQETASVSKYQVGTITATECHQTARADTRVTSCEVSLRVGDTAFGVLYAAPVGTDNVRYETGRELLVLVGEDTITYNDMLGNSFQVPILSRATVTSPGER
jgi:hypothetical protein